MEEEGIKGCVYLRFPEGKLKALTLSYDDGVEQDEHLIGILRAHGMRGTFNLNAGLYAPEGTVFRPGVISRRLLYGAGRSAPSLPSAFGRLSSKCNTEEHLKRRAPTQSFAGPVIQVVESRGEVSGRNRVEITALREEKAKKAIGILIAATLPGLVRFGKEDGSVQLFLKLMKLRKFRAIVQRKAMNRQAGQSRNNRLTRFSGRPGGYRRTLNVA